MFTARSVFVSLSETQPFTYEQLRQRLQEIWAENIQYVPAEFGPDDLLEVAVLHRWIARDGNGFIRIHVA